MDRMLILKAIADETRMNILLLLLQHNYCVRALARKLNLSEAAVSQHLKIFREAKLITGEKRGYYIHYKVNRSLLHELAVDMEGLAAIDRQICTPAEGGCRPSEQERCHVRKDKCAAGGNPICRAQDSEDRQIERHGHCRCIKPD